MIISLAHEASYPGQTSMSAHPEGATPNLPTKIIPTNIP